MGQTPISPGRVRPADWIVEMLRIRRAEFPLGHSIRSAVAVGGPFIVGSLTGHLITAMWIGLATLLLAAGEREGTYRLNFTIIAISTPIAAAGYLLGFIQDAPIAALVVLAALLAFLMGVIAGLGPAFSVGGMQFLLVASIALGVKGIDWWEPIGLYFAGGVLYAALLGIEMLLVPARPQRAVLVPMLTALADLARARHDDLAEGGDRTAAARGRATAALRAATTRVAEFSVRTAGSAGSWTLDDGVTGAAERVQAFLIGDRDPAAAEIAERRLRALAAEVAAGRSADAGEPATEPAVAGSSRGAALLSTRIDELADALRPRKRPAGARHERLVSGGIGREVVLAAARLALCYGIAVAAREYFPYGHWFWVPLTVCMVMKPDFGSVFARAILRVIGTVVAVALASLLLLVVPKGVGLGILIAAFAALVPWLMMKSYALQALAITPIVIFLVDVITPGDGGNFSWERIAATTIGGAIVIVFGYLIWPHSRRAWVAGTFTAAMAGIATHLRVAGTAVPEDAGLAADRHDELVGARRAATRAMSDLQTRLERALCEPPPANTVARAWIPAVDAARRLADTVTAYATDRVAGEAPPDEQESALLAAAIRRAGEGGQPADPPAPDDLALRPVAVQLARVRARLADT
ncbi:FUSC family protein [Gordonia sp. (in: high G+C Gram-positive bacteria)]|uniref:FUSC family protein n=1 Tax=Gordonia sp. (in: high G+C Gram-positive bacteria) TaxID=84139 RepID=UPI003528E0CF